MNRGLRVRFPGGLRVVARIILASQAALGVVLAAAWVARVRADTDAENGMFVPARVCALCHDSSPRAEAMRDAKGSPIAPFDLWRSTMMANAARDPFWRAVVAAETAATPSQQVAIEAKCARCHAPMAEIAADRSPEGHRHLAALLACDCDTSERARDGVSCTVCHRIRPDGLGTPASFSGGFQVDGEPAAFGPHRDPFAMPMLRHSGFRPVHADHVRGSALCASCHTLETSTLTEAGRPTGTRLMEQAPYLEWRNSIYVTERGRSDPEARSCQDCHVPTTDEHGRPIRTRIAHNPGGRDWPPIGDRAPFGRHLFVGGNTWMGEILRDHRVRLSAPAPVSAFDATISHARHQLTSRTAGIEIPQVVRHDHELRVTVSVENRTGHKLPTGFPSRRAWIRFEVRDRTGAIVFRSGAFDGRGRLLDPDDRVPATEHAGGAVRPHHRQIRDDREVQVYEAVMADTAGDPTFRLLRGASYRKDNRLLPRGWRADHPDAAATTPAGVHGDADFLGGGDRIDYVVEAPVEDGPYAIEAMLCYQSLGTRFVNEVLAVDAPAIRAFEDLYRAGDPRPERLAAATTTAR